MAYDPAIHHRHSIRMKEYDYSSRGLYFVTICTASWETFLARVKGARSHLSASGKVALSTWLGLAARFPCVELDAFVVMPNHVHGIVALVGTGPPAGGHFMRGAASSAPTLGKVMRAYKSLCAIEINTILGRKGTPVWQRNYYEHIIRNGKELPGAQQYILENPARWETDPENLQAKNPDSRTPWDEDGATTVF